MIIECSTINLGACIVLAFLCSSGSFSSTVWSLGRCVIGENKKKMQLTSYLGVLRIEIMLKVDHAFRSAADPLAQLYSRDRTSKVESQPRG